ncbi:O-antigen ligase [Colwellia sp. BRX8-9]|uniref:O-antigen ligase family protein n=1 Tax=Colwellia sp. BRX8-9 TaxID=2759831 RepID=UPI0015F5488E|nr:O-antigen ligase family protein [Colwellia sp. BRX8-9]MBA6348690.1 O-antigen ligase family protein [Colwellia sp. BRX8-9]
MPITAIGFVLVFMVGSLFTLKKPLAGILLYFFCFYMHPPGKYWGSFLPEIRWTLIVAVLTLISVFIHEKNKGDWLKFKETKLLIAFLVFVGLQFPFVLSTGWHQVYFILLVKLLILYFLLITIINTKEKLVMVIIANLIGCAYIGFTALQTHAGGRFERAGLPSINDSNLLAIHVIPIVVAGAFLFLSGAVKKKYWLLIPLAFAGNLIIMSGSRGAIGALAVTGLFLILFSAKEFRGRLIKWGAVVVIALTFVSIDLIVQRIASITEAESAEEVDISAQSRMVIINAQIEMFNENMLIGNGHRTTLLLSPVYIDQKYLTNTAAGALRGSHNLTMTMLADHGIIGGTLFFLIILSVIKTGLSVSRNKEHDRDLRLIMFGLTGGMIGVMAASQFANSKVLEITIWIIALIIVAQNVTMKRQLSGLKK